MARSSLATAFISVSNHTAGRQKPIRTISVHHMAGRATAAACANTLQNRGVSAHYGIGVGGEIACYVEEQNTAWSLGNWDANCENISIEVSNSATGGDWPVSDESLDSAIKLVADIAKRNNLGTLVVGQNLVMHKQYKATNCPGPYLEARFQFIVDQANALNSANAPAVELPAPSKKTLAEVVNDVIAGKYGNQPGRQQKLEAEGWNYEEVRQAVNAKLGTKTQPVLKSVDTIANEVIAGLWKNQPERQKLLEAAGYNYEQVRQAVNRKLGVK